MRLSVKPYSADDLRELVSLFNQGARERPFYATIDTDHFHRVIEAKHYFVPEGLLVAREGEQLVGFIHCGFGPAQTLEGVDLGKGTIELLAFPPERPDVGDRVVEEGLGFLGRRGALEVDGIGVRWRYPHYKGIWNGLEPLLSRSSDGHILRALERAGFEEYLSSVLMVSEFEVPFPLEQPAIRRFRPRPLDDRWERDRWRGIDVRQCVALIGDQEVGQCTYAALERLNRDRGREIGCIGSLGVEEAYRRRGIGTMLVGSALNAMFAEGVREAVLATQENNRAAQATYGRFGFRPLDRLVACARRL